MGRVPKIVPIAPISSAARGVEIKRPVEAVRGHLLRRNQDLTPLYAQSSEHRLWFAGIRGIA
jgi:hypothetical protein